jgi:hypothetical protein
VGLLASERIPQDKTIFYGLISDGIHTHPAALRIAHRVHPSGKAKLAFFVQPMMWLARGQDLLAVYDAGFAVFSCYVPMVQVD